MGSDNPSGAGNQQERPGIEQWIVGFVDGEGCFSISVVRNPVCRLGWQVQHEFSVTQAASSRPALELLVKEFGCGRLIENRRTDKPSRVFASLLREASRGLGGCRGAVLRRASAENREATRLRQVRDRVAINAVRRAPRGSRAPMDRSGDRAYESEATVSISGILRGHTPANSSRRRAEEMVLASWRHGGSLERNSLSGKFRPARMA
jgi:hypothetical protein